VVSARIASLLSSIAVEGEVSPFDPAIKNDPARRRLYDWAAWERLYRGEHDRFAELELLDLPDEVLKEAYYINGPHKEFLHSLFSLDTQRIAPRYAYTVVANTFENRLYISYATSFNYFDRFEALKEQYAKILKSLNHMCWESIQYVLYVVEEARIEEIRKKVHEFYSKIPAKYIDVVVGSDIVDLYVPRQLKGYVIGRGGATIQKLQQLLGRRVYVHENPSLTELYADEHPELPKDPEVAKLVAQILPLLKELEHKGVTLKQLEKLIEEMERPESEGQDEGW
jgi:transcription antitermination factor NusA-like protein